MHHPRLSSAITSTSPLCPAEVASQRPVLCYPLLAEGTCWGAARYAYNQENGTGQEAGGMT
jgi:hypothetical protein